MQSVGRIVKNPFEIADGNSDAIRIFSYKKKSLHASEQERPRCQGKTGEQ